MMRSPAQRGSLAALLRRAASQQQQQLIQGQLGAAVAVVLQSLPSGLSWPPGSNAVASSSRCYSSTGTASASAGGLRRSVSQPALPPSAAAAAAAAAARASLLSHCQVGTSLLGLQQLAAGGARGYAGMARGGRRGPRQPPVPEGPPAPKRNQEITAREVRVLFPAEEDKQATVMTLQQALKEARHRKLDLIEVTAAADPPVCRIADFDKVLYEARRKAKAAEKAAREQKRLSEPKEVRVGCHIAQHDLEVKMKQARRFVEEGHHLRLVVAFKGGVEQALGREMVAFLLEQLEGLVVVRNEKSLEKPLGNHFAVLLTPIKENNKPPTGKPEA